MADAQNERTDRRGRRRSRRSHRGNPERPPSPGHGPATETAPDAVVIAGPDVVSTPAVNEPVDFVRPGNAAPPTDRVDVYCMHHMALSPEHKPVTSRTNMTSLRHLAVDHFGEATLFCDCLHNGPHEWSPSLQRLEIAVELNQCLTDSTRDA